VIGQLSHDGIGWKTRVKIVICQWWVSIRLLLVKLSHDGIGWKTRVKIVICQWWVSICLLLVKLVGLGPCIVKTRFVSSSTDKHYMYSLDSEDDFHSGCRNVSHQQQFFSELLSPGWSQHTNYWYSWVQTIYYVTEINSLFKYEILGDLMYCTNLPGRPEMLSNRNILLTQTL